jgi:capsular exopolysaccharide synthesis family protein
MNGSENIQLLDYLRAVRQRWRLLALVVVVTTGVAVGVSLSSDKQYDASAELLLRGQEPVNTLLDPNGGGGSNDPERELNTDVQLIKVSANAFAVLRQLKLDRSADDLLAQVTTDTSSTSNIVTLTVRDRDPALAARIANAFATTYVQFRLNTARQRYRDAADLAQNQLLALSPADRRSVQGRELQARQRELQIAAALQTGGAEIVRRASVPSSASRPRPKLSAALGLFLGLLLGVAAALVLNLVDRRFKDEREVEDFFGLPVLAAIPRPARRGSDLDDAAQREAFGLLAANLRMSTTGPASSVVMITSPAPGDGKTSVTLGVARAYAQLGLRVIAIEADLRRPSFARFADVSASGGVTGVLAGGAVARELIWLDATTLQPSGIDTGGGGAIGLLPAGELPDNPQRALSDPAMSVIIDVARTLADIVLIDTAPVGTVNDATVLGRMVEGVAVVTRLNQTNKDAARRAKRTLEKLGADLLGLVITDAGGGKRHHYYSPTPPAGPPRERSAVQGGRD